MQCGRLGIVLFLHFITGHKLFMGWQLFILYTFDRKVVNIKKRNKIKCFL